MMYNSNNLVGCEYKKKRRWEKKTLRKERKSREKTKVLMKGTRCSR